MSSTVGLKVLRLYSQVIGSEGLWPQLIHCASFPSTAPYFKGTEVIGLEVWIYNILIPEDCPDIGKASKTIPDVSRIENDRV
jgi:hypothetical protein